MNTFRLSGRFDFYLSIAHDKGLCALVKRCNISENRLKNKASKRDIETSYQRLINDDKNHRCVSYEGEIPFDNYLRIDNSDMEPDKAARLIQETFNL